MPFIYEDTLLTDRDKVRRAINDVTWGSGPLPGDANFSDEEIAGFIIIEGTWQRAVAAAFEALASAWAIHQSFTAGDMQVGQTSIGLAYRAQAKDWRDRFGVVGTTTCGSSAVIRADGYSDDLDNIETDA